MACIKVRVFVVLRLPLSISTHETAPSSSYAARRGRPIRGGGRQTAPSDGLIGRYYRQPRTPRAGPARMPRIGASSCMVRFR
jgi:hypothetical protein